MIPPPKVAVPQSPDFVKNIDLHVERSVCVRLFACCTHTQRFSHGNPFFRGTGGLAYFVPKWRPPPVP